MPSVVEVEIIGTRGSSPREAGARMWVSEDGARGTIGGGALEHAALAIAREMLRAGEVRREQRIALGASLGQCCGGEVRVRFSLRRELPAQAEPPAFDALLFGAGHVGREVARILERLPCRLTWVDPRAEMFPAEVAQNVRIVCEEEPAVAVDEAPSGAYFLVMTHSHALDFEIVARALRRADFAYLGLIGSETKAARFRARLARRGFGAGEIARLTAPIGLFKGGKHPAEIAVSALAQVLEQVARRARARAAA